MWLFEEYLDMRHSRRKKRL